MSRRASKSMYHRLRHIWANLNDKWLGIDTDDGAFSNAQDRPENEPNDIVQKKSIYGDAYAYHTPDYLYVYKIADFLSKSGAGGGVFYDLGCGMGRIICVMARNRFHRVVGIELREDLCDIANRNASKLRNRKCPIEVVCDDVLRANLDEGTVYFMFNPFGAATMSSVLNRIYRTLEQHNRDITIIYYNPVFEAALRSEPWLKKIHEFSTMNGICVQFFKNNCLNGIANGDHGCKNVAKR